MFTVVPKVGASERVPAATIIVVLLPRVRLEPFVKVPDQSVRVPLLLTVVAPLRVAPDELDIVNP